MKKLLLITAVLAFVMASCGEKKKKDTESTEATPQQEVVEIVDAAADTLQVTLEEAAQDIKETTEKLDEALKELE